MLYLANPLAIDNNKPDLKLCCNAKIQAHSPLAKPPRLPSIALRPCNPVFNTPVTEVFLYFSSAFLIDSLSENKILSTAPLASFPFSCASSTDFLNKLIASLRYISCLSSSITEVQAISLLPMDLFILLILFHKTELFNLFCSFSIEFSSLLSSTLLNNSFIDSIRSSSRLTSGFDKNLTIKLDFSNAAVVSSDGSFLS